MADISHFDFQKTYQSRTAEITPLNTTNTVFVALLEVKRYLIYDYVRGQVLREI